MILRLCGVSREHVRFHCCDEREDKQRQDCQHFYQLGLSKHRHSSRRMEKRPFPVDTPRRGEVWRQTKQPRQKMCSLNMTCVPPGVNHRDSMKSGNKQLTAR